MHFNLPSGIHLVNTSYYNTAYVYRVSDKMRGVTFMNTGYYYYQVLPIENDIN